jgi:hypothetical protein
MSITYERNGIKKTVKINHSVAVKMVIMFMDLKYNIIEIK